MKSFLFIYSVFLIAGCSSTKAPEAFEITKDWINEISSLVPESESQDEQKLLVISLATGYKHWIIPHNEVLLQEIGKKNKISVQIANDISVFEKDSLAQYDAIVLNNSCPKRDNRHLIYDGLSESLDSAQRWQEALRLENNLIDYVHNGGGLVVLHGGLTTFNNSEKFSQMVGASFDYHPKQQAFTLSVADPSHQLTADLPPEFEFFGEPYFLKGAFPTRNFKTLLNMTTSNLEGLRESPVSTSHPVAWLKKYGFGRVFVSAPTHNAQNFSKQGFVSFITKGILYASGNLEADDTETPTYAPKWIKKEVLFEDTGTDDWTQKWFLDGTKATLENTEKGLFFEAGPDWANDSSHAVLWTKESFEGNILIEFDYTRTEDETRGVHILYFHATGTGDEEYPEDVYDWKEKRNIPTMSTYFRNMNAYHLSYAAFRSNDDGVYDYVRLRQYEALYRLGGTEILPDNFRTGLFKKGMTYHFEVSKFNDTIQMYVENKAIPSERALYSWVLSAKPQLEHGRIAIRHMYTRSAIYKDFKVWKIK